MGSLSTELFSISNRSPHFRPGWQKEYVQRSSQDDSPRNLFSALAAIPTRKTPSFPTLQERALLAADPQSLLGICLRRHEVRMLRAVADQFRGRGDLFLLLVEESLQRYQTPQGQIRQKVQSLRENLDSLRRNDDILLPIDLLHELVHTLYSHLFKISQEQGCKVPFFFEELWLIWVFLPFFDQTKALNIDSFSAYFSLPQIQRVVQEQGEEISSADTLDADGTRDEPRDRHWQLLTIAFCSTAFWVSHLVVASFFQQNRQRSWESTSILGAAVLAQDCNLVEIVLAYLEPKKVPASGGGMREELLTPRGEQIGRWLKIAVENRDKRMVTVLLKSGLSVNMPNNGPDSFSSALLRALQMQSRSIVLELNKYPPKVKEVDFWQDPLYGQLFCRALKHKRTLWIANMLGEHPSCPTIATRGKWGLGHALVIASARNYEPIVEKILSFSSAATIVASGEYSLQLAAKRTTDRKIRDAIRAFLKKHHPSPLQQTVSRLTRSLSEGQLFKRPSRVFRSTGSEP